MSTEAQWNRAFGSSDLRYFEAVFIAMWNIALALRDDPQLVWC